QENSLLTADQVPLPRDLDAHTQRRNERPIVGPAAGTNPRSKPVQNRLPRKTFEQSEAHTGKACSSPRHATSSRRAKNPLPGCSCSLIVVALGSPNPLSRTRTRASCRGSYCRCLKRAPSPEEALVKTTFTVLPRKQRRTAPEGAALPVTSLSCSINRVPAFV